MASTYLSLHYHIVFSTKDQMQSISDEWRTRLHEYLGGTVDGLGGISQRVGGVQDHLHLLVGLKATHCLADFMRELKKAGSIWIHDEIRDRSSAGNFSFSPLITGFNGAGGNALASFLLGQVNAASIQASKRRIVRERFHPK